MYTVCCKCVEERDSSEYIFRELMEIADYLKMWEQITTFYVVRQRGSHGRRVTFKIKNPSLLLSILKDAWHIKATELHVCGRIFLNKVSASSESETLSDMTEFNSLPPLVQPMLIKFENVIIFLPSNRMS